MSTVLSIQSAVTYGHVGNSAAVFPLQRMGHEVWPINTVHFSNHTGYGAWRGTLTPASEVLDILRGVEERGVLGHVDAVLSGYQGGTDIAEAILTAVEKVRNAQPHALYICDPVMGNAASGCHVDDAIPPLLRDVVVPHADVVTPNQFELGFLTGHEELSHASTLEALFAAVDALHDQGPSTILVTSVERTDHAPDTVEMLAVTTGRAPHGCATGIATGEPEAWLISTPHLPCTVNGSGDVTASLFTGNLLRGASLRDALEATASGIFSLLETTYTAHSRELLLIDAQEAYVQPRRTFTATRVK